MFADMRGRPGSSHFATENFHVCIEPFTVFLAHGSALYALQNETETEGPPLDEWVKSMQCRGYGLTCTGTQTVLYLSKRHASPQRTLCTR